MTDHPKGGDPPFTTKHVLTIQLTAVHGDATDGPMHRATALSLENAARFMSDTLVHQIAQMIQFALQNDDRAKPGAKLPPVLVSVHAQQVIGALSNEERAAYAAEQHLDAGATAPTSPTLQ